MVSDIDLYLDSLSKDIKELDLSSKGLKYLPELTSFTNLEILYCSDNYLSSLPLLPENLKKLYCGWNELTSLPLLPKNLKRLFCFRNKLTSLPFLPEKLDTLNCDSNLLTSLPLLPKNLKILICNNNQLTSLPFLPEQIEDVCCIHNKLTYLPLLPENIRTINYCENPICEIAKFNKLYVLKSNVKILDQFRFLYYSLKFKKRFRDWLWTKVREPRIREKYHYRYLLENLADEETDLDEVLAAW